MQPSQLPLGNSLPSPCDEYVDDFINTPNNLTPRIQPQSTPLRASCAMAGDVANSSHTGNASQRSLLSPRMLRPSPPRRLSHSSQSPRQRNTSLTASLGTPLRALDAPGPAEPPATCPGLRDAAVAALLPMGPPLDESFSEPLVPASHEPPSSLPPLSSPSREAAPTSATASTATAAPAVFMRFSMRLESPTSSGAGPSLRLPARSPIVPAEAAFRAGVGTRPPALIAWVGGDHPPSPLHPQPGPQQQQQQHQQTPVEPSTASAAPAGEGSPPAGMTSVRPVSMEWVRGAGSLLATEAEDGPAVRRSKLACFRRSVASLVAATSAAPDTAFKRLFQELRDQPGISEAAAAAAIAASTSTGSSPIELPLLPPATHKGRPFAAEPAASAALHASPPDISSRRTRRRKRPKGAPPPAAAGTLASWRPAGIAQSSPRRVSADGWRTNRSPLATHHIAPPTAPHTVGGARHGGDALPRASTAGEPSQSATALLSEASSPSPSAPPQSTLPQPPPGGSVPSETLSLPLSAVTATLPPSPQTHGAAAAMGSPSRHPATRHTPPTVWGRRALEEFLAAVSADESAGAPHTSVDEEADSRETAATGATVTGHHGAVGHGIHKGGGCAACRLRAQRRLLRQLGGADALAALQEAVARPAGRAVHAEEQLRRDASAQTSRALLAPLLEPFNKKEAEARAAPSGGSSGEGLAAPADNVDTLLARVETLLRCGTLDLPRSSRLNGLQASGAARALAMRVSALREELGRLGADEAQPTTPSTMAAAWQEWARLLPPQMVEHTQMVAEDLLAQAVRFADLCERTSVPPPITRAATTTNRADEATSRDSTALFPIAVAPPTNEAASSNSVALRHLLDGLHQELTSLSERFPVQTSPPPEQQQQHPQSNTPQPLPLPPPHVQSSPPQLPQPQPQPPMLLPPSPLQQQQPQTEGGSSTCPSAPTGQSGPLPPPPPQQEPPPTDILLSSRTPGGQEGPSQPSPPAPSQPLPHPSPSTSKQPMGHAAMPSSTTPPLAARKLATLGTPTRPSTRERVVSSKAAVTSGETSARSRQSATPRSPRHDSTPRSAITAPGASSKAGIGRHGTPATTGAGRKTASKLARTATERPDPKGLEGCTPPVTLPPVAPTSPVPPRSPTPPTAPHGPPTASLLQGPVSSATPTAASSSAPLSGIAPSPAAPAPVTSSPSALGDSAALPTHTNSVAAIASSMQSAPAVPTATAAVVPEKHKNIAGAPGGTLPVVKPPSANAPLTIPVQPEEPRHLVQQKVSPEDIEHPQQPPRPRAAESPAPSEESSQVMPFSPPLARVLMLIVQMSWFTSPPASPTPADTAAPPAPPARPTTFEAPRESRPAPKNPPDSAAASRSGREMPALPSGGDEGVVDSRLGTPSLTHQPWPPSVAPGAHLVQIALSVPPTHLGEASPHPSTSALAERQQQPRPLCGLGGGIGPPASTVLARPNTSAIGGQSAVGLPTLVDQAAAFSARSISHLSRPVEHDTPAVPQIVQREISADDDDYVDDLSSPSPLSKEEDANPHTTIATAKSTSELKKSTSKTTFDGDDDDLSVGSAPSLSASLLDNEGTRKP